MAKCGNCKHLLVPSEWPAKCMHPKNLRNETSSYSDPDEPGEETLYIYKKPIQTPIKKNKYGNCPDYEYEIKFSTLFYITAFVVLFFIIIQG